ncbi:outer membrane lipoprotein LolB [Nitrosomonas sp. Nm84]|uniref:lipoprotein insertase outer membrane protein LolB n=1 Tax=Nitrosomonas sp. Nm84 TaxID=200124 RepID=UPI000D755557|nr:lipoprotein insertase outer membrane protein LolB [Nitrosomonas sp. Nm84]PXW86892.1 outer membrane lipoprotein LolB [Nitrosomonas sp. Nm84]
MCRSFFNGLLEIAGYFWINSESSNRTVKSLKLLSPWRFSANQQIIYAGILICSAFPWISGCVTLTDQTTADTTVKTILIEPATGAQAAPATDFNLLGRISIQSPNQSSSGSFRWQHLASSDEILLFTPLGQAVAEITKDQEGVRLITSKLEAFYANDVESLTEEILGWRLPLEGLQYWIQGMHSPVTAAEKDLDNKDQVVAIRQDGWKIYYSNYTPAQLNHPLLPRVLYLTYENLKIKLVIDNWKVE